MLLCRGKTVKILGSDYDGTLTFGGIGEEKISAIQKWREAGNKFGIVSGRDISFRKMLLEMNFGLKIDFFASCNGGLITDGEGNKISESRSECVDIRALLGDLFAFGCGFARVCAQTNTVVVEDLQNVPEWLLTEDMRSLCNLPKIEYFNQISVMLPTQEASMDVTSRIAQKYGESLNPLRNGKWIDIVPASVNKAEGLRRVAEHFGCSYDCIIAVGDSTNDTDMIREFYSYAMANGVDEIKALANGIVSDVTEIIEKEI
jgi:hydroxymethylpyrimidine pyrophosphatase-like HAD family hydrolase